MKKWADYINPIQSVQSSKAEHQDDRKAWWRCFSPNLCQSMWNITCFITNLAKRTRQFAVWVFSQPYLQRIVPFCSDHRVPRLKTYWCRRWAWLDWRTPKVGAAKFQDRALCISTTWPPGGQQGIVLSTDARHQAGVCQIKMLEVLGRRQQISGTIFAPAEFAWEPVEWLVGYAHIVHFDCILNLAWSSSPSLCSTVASKPIQYE